MKRVILLVLPLLLLSFAFAETTYTIGTGSALSMNAPCTSTLAYSISGTIYPADDLSAIAAGSITKIGYSVQQAHATTLANQKIYMRHTNAEYYNTNGSSFTISASYKDAFQLVFSGSIAYNSVGWKTIELDTPFEYDGVSGIEIYYEDLLGTPVYSVYFHGTTQANYKSFNKGFFDPAANDWIVATRTIRPNLQLTITQAPTPPAYDIMPDVEVALKDAADQEIARATITGDNFLGANEVTGFTPTPFLNANFTPTVHAVWDLIGTGTATINFSTAAEWFAYVQGGEWQAVEGPLTNHPITVNLGSKDADFEFAIGTGENPTLPVELSLFAATYNVTVNQVELVWRTETESQLSGYRVFRSNSNSLANAIVISPYMIDATNTSSVHDYMYVDKNIEDGVYYYWLEAVGYNTSEFYGPRTATIDTHDSSTVPDLPDYTKLGTAYPNPFNPTTTISYDLRDSSRVRLDIYNIMGQLVRTLVNETQAGGSYQVKFDGKDDKGHNLSSGVYFYRMQANGYQNTRKMIMMK